MQQVCSNKLAGCRFQTKTWGFFFFRFPAACFRLCLDVFGAPVKDTEYKGSKHCWCPWRWSFSTGHPRKDFMRKPVAVFRRKATRMCLCVLRVDHHGLLQMAANELRQTLFASWSNYVPVGWLTALWTLRWCVLRDPTMTWFQRASKVLVNHNSFIPFKGFFCDSTHRRYVLLGLLVSSWRWPASRAKIDLKLMGLVWLKWKALWENDQTCLSDVTWWSCSFGVVGSWISLFFLRFLKKSVF